MTTRFGWNRMLACVVDISGVAVVVAVVVVVAAVVVVTLLMVVVAVVVAVVAVVVVVVVVVVDCVVANVGEGIEGGGVDVMECWEK